MLHTVLLTCAILVAIALERNGVKISEAYNEQCRYQPNVFPRNPYDSQQNPFGYRRPSQPDTNNYQGRLGNVQNWRNSPGSDKSSFPINGGLGQRPQPLWWSEDVTTLTDNNFYNLVINSDDVWMVLFYAPWCPHSRNTVPHWNSAATYLKGKVQFGQLDVTVNKLINNQFNIRGIPSIKYFGRESKSVTNAVNYYGDRTSNDIIQWAVNHLVQEPQVEVTQPVLLIQMETTPFVETSEAPIEEDDIGIELEDLKPMVTRPSASGETLVNTTTVVQMTTYPEAVTENGDVSTSLNDQSTMSSFRLNLDQRIQAFDSVGAPKSKGLNYAGIVLGVVGSIVLISLLVVVIWLVDKHFIKRRNVWKSVNETPEAV